MMKDEPMEQFRPYADESDVLTVGSLTIENHVDRVTLMGDVELTRDKKGLALARELKALPEAVKVEPPQKVKNPFG